MTLHELIDYLQKEDQSKVVPMGFKNPHSYRGCYEDLAFEPAACVTVREMLVCAMGASGKTFHGYKGGEYKMDEWTTVWLASYEERGEEIGVVLLNYMMGKY